MSNSTPDIEEILDDELLLPNQRNTNGSTESLRVAGEHRETIQTERLEDIIKARREAHKSVSSASMNELEARINNRVPRGEAVQIVDEHVYAQVWSLITEVERLLRLTDLGQHYWTNKEIGTISLPVGDDGDVVEVEGMPGEEDDADSALDEDWLAPNRPMRKVSRPSTGPEVEDEYTVTGLREFLRIPDEVTLTIERVEFDADSMSESVVREEVTRPIHVPRELSRSAYRVVTEFLGELGVGLKPESEGGMSFDVDDIN